MKYLITILFVFTFIAGKAQKGTIRVNQDTMTNVWMENSSIDVNIQDQVTPPLDLFFLKSKRSPTTLKYATSIDDTCLVLNDTVLFRPGDYVGIFSGTSLEGRFYFGTIKSRSNDTICMDTPLDYAFNETDPVVSTTRDLNVDASSETQIFSIQGAGVGSPVSIDITKIIITIVTSGTPDFGMFGDIAGGLDHGIVLRRYNGIVNNIFNIKKNSDIATITYNYNVLEAAKHGVAGIVAEIKFAGQQNHGVAIRLNPGDRLDLLLQKGDDLSTLLDFKVVGQGHIVLD